MTTSPRPRPDLAPTSGATSPGDLAPTPPTLRVGAKSRGELDTPTTNHLTSPQGRSHKHVTGPRSIPAWDAALDYLADQHWHPIPELIQVMVAGSDLHRRTIQNYLASASRRCWITRRRGQVRLRDRRAFEGALEEAGRG